MNNTLQNIFIPEPCSQKWENLSGHDRKRFCKSCDKFVFDFTERPAEEFFEVYRKTRGNVCVSFFEDQINQDLRYLQPVKRKMPRLHFSILISFALTFLNPESQASECSEVQSCEFVQRNFHEDSLFVKGKVKTVDSDKFLPGVRIKIRSADGKLLAAGTTDQSGEFLIATPSEVIPGDTLILECSKRTVRTSMAKYIYEAQIVKVVFSKEEDLLLYVKEAKRSRRFIRILPRRRIMGCPAHFW